MKMHVTLLIPLSILLSSSESALSTSECTAAKVDNHQIACESVVKMVSLAAFRMRSDLHKSKKDAAQKLIDEHILESAAAKAGVPANEFFRESIDRLVQPIQPAEAQAVVDLLPGRIPGVTPEDKLKNASDALASIRRAQAQKKFLMELRAQYKVQILLQGPELADSEIDSIPYANPEAKRRLYVFSDFECLYCSQLAKSLQSVLMRTSSDIGVHFVNNPLPNHPFAKTAAIASICVSEQGGFREFHDRLFARQGSLSLAAIMDDARHSVRSEQELMKCQNSSRALGRVEKQSAASRHLRLGSTPSMLIDGEFFEGHPGETELERILARPSQQ